MRTLISMTLGICAAASLIGGFVGCYGAAEPGNALNGAVWFFAGCGAAALYAGLAVLVSDVEEMRHRREPPPPGALR